MHILDVRVDNLSKGEIENKISIFLLEPRFHQITTVNPEFILEAQKNPEFRDVLNASDLNVADGVGIWFAFLRFGKFLKNRLTGADLMLEILQIAEEKKLKIFLAINKAGLSSFEETRDAILKKFPGLEVDGMNLDCHSCPRYARINSDKNLVANFLVSTLDSRMHGNDKYILFCNFGAPHQELFINSQKCDTIRLAMGVGGAFDFLTGKVRRAPVLMQKLGFEWLWRALQSQEWKFKKQRLIRVFRSAIIFPIRVIFNR